MVTRYVAPPSRHAVDRHGYSADRATRRLNGCDTDDRDTWSNVCQDGRRYTFKQHPEGKSWDVSIDDPVSGENITRFVCKSKNWIARKLLWCSFVVVFAYVAAAMVGIVG